MAAGSQDRKLPPSLAYPIIAMSILLFLVSLINLSHRFDGTLMTCLSLVVAVSEIGLGIRIFAWLRRNKEKAAN